MSRARDQHGEPGVWVFTSFLLSFCISGPMRRRGSHLVLVAFYKPMYSSGLRTYSFPLCTRWPAAWHDRKSSSREWRESLPMAPPVGGRGPGRHDRLASNHLDSGHSPHSWSEFLVTNQRAMLLNLPECAFGSHNSDLALPSAPPPSHHGLVLPLRDAPLS